MLDPADGPAAPTAPWDDRRREQLVMAAARDNARWCALVAATHAVLGRTDDDAWTCPRRTPPGYPDAVTLRPGVDAAGVLARVDGTAPDCSVKDSFADLDLSPYGLRELFTADWIGHPNEQRRAPGAAGPRWARVTDPAALRSWEDARGNASADRVLRPPLLAEPDVTVVAGLDGAEVVAGFVLTTGEPSVVGVSNVFAAGCTPADVWTGVLAWAGRHHRGRALVGYERGDDLLAPLRCGFTVLGPLRVWMAPDPAVATTVDAAPDPAVAATVDVAPDPPVADPGRAG